MNTQLKHDSRDLKFRSPQGAQPCGRFVQLRLQVKSSAQPKNVWLRQWWQNREEKVQMLPEDGGFYAVHIQMPYSTGLLWYFFIVEQADGSLVYYGNAEDGLGGEGQVYFHEPPSYQITVYAANYSTPEWMRSGIMYQIFPDRFYAGKSLKKKQVPDHASVHSTWSDLPDLYVDPTSGDNMANDFFGGDLEGIRQKLDYIQKLGISVIYLNPIFKARSNHKYDTGDYEQVDPMFGTNQEFERLCAEAEQRGIRIMLDGVFSHTGSDSRYFNKYGNYPDQGAYQSKESPFYRWYSFENWPQKYDSWWGFKTLPNVNEMEPSYLDFIIRGKNAVIAQWLGRGASGWRLDVADELPMAFLRMLRSRVKTENPNAAVLGEVWEDASNKVAYGSPRSYCLGDTLDSVMNYPLRDGLLEFMCLKIDAFVLERRLCALQENYPVPFLYSLMNLLGSHDRARVLNVLGGLDGSALPRSAQRDLHLNAQQYSVARRRFVALWRFVCALPGMPCLYYGDEAGMQGAADPFCRGTYPWEHEDSDLLEEIASINANRNASAVLTRGFARVFSVSSKVICVLRHSRANQDAFGKQLDNQACLCLLSSSDQPEAITIAPDQLPELQLRHPIRVVLDPHSCAFRGGFVAK